MRKKKTAAEEHAEFLMQAYAGLVLRGFDRERDVPDPILRRVWRLGKRAWRLQRRAEGKTAEHGK